MTFEEVHVYNMEVAVRGMRNPMMSHGKSTPKGDEALALSLIRAGAPHRKFLRQIFVSADICKFPVYWLVEFDTYTVGCTKDVSSTMHKITSRPLTKDDFEEPETPLGRAWLADTLEALNVCRDNYLLDKARDEEEAEREFRDLKRMLPSSYLYERMTWTGNYEVLANILKWRRNHRLPAWHEFCEEFIMKLPHADWIEEAARN